MKKMILIGLLLMTSQSSMAAGLINEMQMCQALISFVEKKLNPAPQNYDKNDVNNVLKGLAAYDQYIQRDIITPGLLQFSKGNAAKAKQLQQQINDYKKTVVKQLEARYQAKRLFTDQAVAMNNCTKKAVPKGQDLESLKVALKTMVKLAQTN